MSVERLGINGTLADWAKSFELRAAAARQRAQDIQYDIQNNDNARFLAGPDGEWTQQLQAAEQEFQQWETLRRAAVAGYFLKDVQNTASFSWELAHGTDVAAMVKDARVIFEAEQIPRQ
jgi:hypothetical protein